MFMPGGGNIFLNLKSSLCMKEKDIRNSAASTISRGDNDDVEDAFSVLSTLSRLADMYLITC